MNKQVRQLEHFLLHQPIWIFFAGIFLVSIIIIQQLGECTWRAYSYYILTVSLLFSPILLFIGFRQTLKGLLSKSVYRLIWLACFLLYVPLLFALQLNQALFSDARAEEIIGMGWLMFAMIEGALIVNRYFAERRNLFSKVLRRVKLEHGILVTIGGVATIYIFFATVVSDSEFQHLSFPGILAYTFQMIILLLVYYGFYLINHYFLIARLYKEKGLIYFVLGFLAMLIILYPVAAQLISLLPLVQHTTIHPLHYASVFDELNFAIPFMGMLLSMPFILVVQWYRQSYQLTLLSREKSETELSMLRQQVNPHFFFNTLNNLYALSLRKDPATPEVVLQLSELMRYVIYKGKEDEVVLNEEIKYIEDYIRLQKLRMHKKLDFRFVKNVADQNITVPPLLFITLVENAFKHGIEPAEGNSYLHLSLQSKAGGLTFVCENSVEEWLDKPSGIGLENLNRRLAIIYPEQEVLKLEKGEGYYRASLKIL